MSEIKEQGMPILLKSLCRIGAHVWILVGNQYTTYQPEDRCSCGLMTWAEYKRGEPGGGDKP
jgi:hypothetical protein